MKWQTAILTSWLLTMLTTSCKSHKPLLTESTGREAIKSQLTVNDDMQLTFALPRWLIDTYFGDHGSLFRIDSCTPPPINDTPTVKTASISPDSTQWVPIVHVFGQRHTLIEDTVAHDWSLHGAGQPQRHNFIHVVCVVGAILFFLLFLRTFRRN